MKDLQPKEMTEKDKETLRRQSQFLNNWMVNTFFKEARVSKTKRKEVLLDAKPAYTQKKASAKNNSKGPEMPKVSKPAAKTATKPTEKSCSKCEKTQPLSEFYHDKSTKDGLTSWCKSCQHAYDVAYWAKKKKEAKTAAKPKAKLPRSEPAQAQA